MGTNQVGNVVIGVMVREWGAVIQTLRKGGGGSLPPPKKIFRPYSKNKSGEGGGGGERAPPLDRPLVIVNTLHHPSGNGFFIQTISARLPCLKNSRDC